MAQADPNLIYPFLVGPFEVRRWRREELEDLRDFHYDPVARGGWQIVERIEDCPRATCRPKKKTDHLADLVWQFEHDGLVQEAVIIDRRTGEIAGNVRVSANRVKLDGQRLTVEEEAALPRRTEVHIFLKQQWQRPADATSPERNGETILRALLGRVFQQVDEVVAESLTYREPVAHLLRKLGFEVLGPADDVTWWRLTRQRWATVRASPT